MSITEELREYAHDCCAMIDDAIHDIADRIDKEHAEAVADALQLRGEPDRWVELPVDADGVPIHVGDEVAWGDGEAFEVMGFGGICMERAFYLNEGGRFCWGIAENCHHVQPDSWESIIKDAIAEGYERMDVFTPCEVGNDELVERCRRLAGEGA